MGEGVDGDAVFTPGLEGEGEREAGCGGAEANPEGGAQGEFVGWGGEAEEDAAGEIGTECGGGAVLDVGPDGEWIRRVFHRVYAGAHGRGAAGF